MQAELLGSGWRSPLFSFCWGWGEEDSELLRGEVERLEGIFLVLNTILERQVKEIKQLNEEVSLIASRDSFGYFLSVSKICTAHSLLLFMWL